MEAALEQACNAERLQSSECSQPSSATLSKQQTTQVVRVLEEAFAAQIYYLQQVRPEESSPLLAFCLISVFVMTRSAEYQVPTTVGF